MQAGTFVLFHVKQHTAGCRGDWEGPGSLVELSG